MGIAEVNIPNSFGLAAVNVERSTAWDSFGRTGSEPLLACRRDPPDRRNKRLAASVDAPSR